MKKRYTNTFAIIAIVLLILSLCSFGTFCSLKSQQGTYDDPIIISTYNDLHSLEKEVNRGNSYKDKYIVITNDISIPVGTEWTPIGSNNNAFSGIVDGKGHRIDGLNFKLNSDAGLFGNLDGIICNLILGDALFDESQKVGAIAVNINENGAVLNCLSEAYPASKKGGGVCYNLDGTMINCVACSSSDFSNRFPLFVEGKDDLMSNCFSAKGGYQELYDTISSAETKANKMEQAVNDLNNRIAGLGNAYENINFCKWKAGELYPQLTQEYIEIPTFTIEGKELNFSEESQGYVVKDFENAIEVTNNADKFTIDIKGVDTIYYENNGVSYKILRNDDYLFADSMNRIKLDDTSISNYELYAMVSSDGQIISEGARLHVNHCDVIELTGKLVGQVVVHNGGKVILNNVDIVSSQGPAIIFEDKEKALEKDCVIELKSESENYLSGCACRDIYYADRIFEGTIESETDLSFCGIGKLSINSALEGIECDGNLIIEEGNYHIECVDDGISCENAYINGGYCYIDAKDDVIDTADLFELNGGRVVGHTPIEFAINGRPSSISSGELAAFSHLGIINIGEKKSGLSKQCRIQFKYEDKYKTGDFIVVTDAFDNPLVAAVAPCDIETFNYSAPNLKDTELHLYLADSVEGEFVDGYCFTPKAFVMKKEFSCDNKKELMTKVDGIFEVE